MSWIQTKHGNIYDLEYPELDSIFIEDIAYHLARIHRFTGATEYSVASHSLYCMQAAIDIGITEKSTLFAVLMHDAHEAFIGDVSSPVKSFLGKVWEQFEARHALTVALRFGLNESPETQVVVRHVDLISLMAEVRDLLMGETQRWGISSEPHWRPVALPASAEAAEAAFLKAFKELK